MYDYIILLCDISVPKNLRTIVHQYFSPSEEEVAWATEMVELAEEADREGKGDAVKDNKIIGPPKEKIARIILAKHKKIALRKAAD